MRAQGTVFMSRTRPVADTSADGKFSLVLLAMDRIDSHRVEPWRITWTGEEARAFWDAHATRLTPGAALQVDVERVRSFTQGRCAPEIHARAVAVSMLPRQQPHQPHQQAQAA